MIEVEIFKDKRNLFSKFTALGHANYDEKGKDIVCAGVSTLTQTSLLALQSVSQVKFDIESEGGYMTVSVFYEDREVETVQAIFTVLKIGIEAMEEQYPEYVKLEIRKG